MVVAGVEAAALFDLPNVADFWQLKPAFTHARVFGQPARRLVLLNCECRQRVTDVTELNRAQGQAADSDCFVDRAATYADHRILAICGSRD